jgi:pSer/pThr/pTyr-binding forkhead associated (FHA) protein
MRPRTGAEARDLLKAEREGTAFVVYRDGADTQVVSRLDPQRPMLTIGRHEACDISLHWDDKVSATHAVLERLGHQWALADDGISLNGTYLNGDRLTARVRLDDGDVLRTGRTLIEFRQPAVGLDMQTLPELGVAPVSLTPMQRKVLVALCRPYKDAGAYQTPATNAEIATELVLTVDAVKTHMRGLFDRFGVGDLPQNQKRAKVVELAFRAGVVSARDL